MEEDGEQDAEVDGRVAALLLDAQDAWPPEGVVPSAALPSCPRSTDKTRTGTGT